MDLIEKAAGKLAELDDEKKNTGEESKEVKSETEEVTNSIFQDDGSSLIEKMVDRESDTPDSASVSEPVVKKTEATPRREDRPAFEQQDDFISMDLDIEYLHRKGMVTPDSSRSKIKEEYRQIKRPLLMNAAGKGNLKSERSNMIMVTSSRANEGKTFSAINLAMSIAAERDKTVLLVDCDVIQPSVAEFFNLESPQGLTDYLSDSASINEIIVRTNLPTFRVIPAGQPHHLANELLASEKMEQLMVELSTRYSDRIVILDSPPLLSTTEAAILSGHVGQILVVVEADSTKQDELEEALAKLPVSNEVAIGVVLNKSQRHMDGNYYSYGSNSSGT